LKKTADDLLRDQEKCGSKNGRAYSAPKVEGFLYCQGEPPGMKKIGGKEWGSTNLLTVDSWESRDCGGFGNFQKALEMSIGIKTSRN